jgi:hypothetical protein
MQLLKFDLTQLKSIKQEGKVNSITFRGLILALFFYWKEGLLETNKNFKCPVGSAS